MKKALPLHPFLFAAWTVLFVYAQNVQFITIRQAWAPLALLTAFSTLLLFAFYLIVKDTMKAGALVSMFTILFFSYGHVFNLFWAEKGYFPTPQSMALMALWVLIFVAGSGLILRLRAGWSESTQILNVIATTLIAFSLVTIGTWEVEAKRVRADAHAEPVALPPVTQAQADPLPDIYYIILDSYAREDILDDIYDYDNSAFLAFLQERGFFVARDSFSNYAQTDLSVASTLNMTYLDDLAATVGQDSSDWRHLEHLVQHNVVTAFLSEQGYDIIAMPSGYSPTDLRSADQYVAESRAWNELETRLVCSTPLPWITVRGNLFDPFGAHREKILYNLNHLVDTAALPSPRFVFLHLLAPHAPFVFDAEGNPIDPTEQFDLGAIGPSNKTGQVRADYVRAYTGQVTFVNRRMMAIVDELIARSARPTIIILQADHGPNALVDWDDLENTYFKEKHAILNAYLLPGDGAKALYDEISPVNTFRVILNHYFGTELELLEDESYFSNRPRPYRFINVTEDVRSGRRPDGTE